MWTITRASAIIIACAVLQSAATAAAATPRGFDGGALKRRPATIIYTGDGSALLAGRGRSGAQAFGHLHWTSWGRRSARAWGDDWHDNCLPDCAGGTFTGYHANVTLHRPGWLGGRRVFTRLTVTYPRSRPPYPFYRHHRTWTARLVWTGSPGVYFWKT